jgi:hypothetical protein
MENGDGYELSAVYGISIEYPSSWSVEVGQLKRDQGVVSFRSGGEECSCTLACSSLEEVRGFRDPGEQARSALDDLKSRSRVEDLQVLEDRSVVVNGHEAVAMRLRATLKTGVFSRAVALRARSTCSTSTVTRRNDVSCSFHLALRTTSTPTYLIT